MSDPRIPKRVFEDSNRIFHLAIPLFGIEQLTQNATHNNISHRNGDLRTYASWIGELRFQFSGNTGQIRTDQGLVLLHRCH